MIFVIFSSLTIFVSCCNDNFDGTQEVKYDLAFQEYVSNIVQSNTKIPDDFIEEKWYKSDPGTYTITWHLDDGVTTRNCSYNYTVPEADSGAKCKDNSVSDELLAINGCKEEVEVEVIFGGYSFFLITSILECKFYVDKNRKYSLH